MIQRTPWGGGRKRGVESLTKDTPPKEGCHWTPPRTVRFPPPSGVSAVFFLYKTPRQSRPEALLEGSKNFRESAFSGTFSSPHTFCTPPYHGPSVVYFLSCVFPVEPQSPNGKNINLYKKWGSRRFRKKCAKKCVKTALFAHFLRKKGAVFRTFPALFGTLSGIGGNPTFCAD